MTFKDYLDWLTILAGAASAVFWLASALVRLPVAMAPATWGSSGQLIGLDSNGSQVDLYPLLIRQARLNGVAAAAASIAAACQVGVKSAGL